MLQRRLGLRLVENFRDRILPDEEGSDYTLEVHGGRVALLCAPGLSVDSIEELRDQVPCAALIVNYPAEIEVLEVIETRTRHERFLQIIDNEDPVEEVPDRVVDVEADLARYTYSVTWSEAEGLYLGMCAEVEGRVFKAKTRTEAFEGIVREVSELAHMDPTWANPALAGPRHTVKFHIEWIREP